MEEGIKDGLSELLFVYLLEDVYRFIHGNSLGPAGFGGSRTLSITTK